VKLRDCPSRKENHSERRHFRCKSLDDSVCDWRVAKREETVKSRSGSDITMFAHSCAFRNTVATAGLLRVHFTH